MRARARRRKALNDAQGFLHVRPSTASSAAAIRHRRSPPPRCNRRPRASSVIPPSAPCDWRSSYMKVFSARAPSVSSRICVRTRWSAVDAVRECAKSSPGIRQGSRGRRAPHLQDQVAHAQEAHEAIRPTSAAVLPSQLDGKVDPDQQTVRAHLETRRRVRWRTLFDTVAVDMQPSKQSGGRYRGRPSCANGSTMIKPGYMAVYQEHVDDGKPENENDRILP